MKKSACLLLICAMLLSLCACGGKTEVSELTLYAAEGNILPMITDIVESYKAEHEGVTVNIETFKTEEELGVRLSNDLMTGKGPDVVFWSEFSSNIDMRRMAENGCFAALDDLFKNDKSFDREKYYGAVLDCGKVNGVQYTVPVGFVMSWNLTKEETFKNSGLADKEIITMKDFMEALAAEDERLGGDGRRSAYGRAQVMGTRSALMSSRLLNIDYDSKTVTADRGALREFMDAYNAHMRGCPGLFDGGYSSPAEFKDSIGFIADDIFPAVNLSLRFLQDFRKDGEKPVFFTYSGYEDNSGYTARSTLEFAVNKNSAAPKLAYEFVRFVMDSDPPALAAMPLAVNGAKKSVPAASFSVNRTKNELYLGAALVSSGVISMKEEYIGKQNDITQKGTTRTNLRIKQTSPAVPFGFFRTYISKRAKAPFAI